MASSGSIEARRRFFSVADANKALPLVRRIVGDIVAQFRVVSDLRQRLTSVNSPSRKRPAPGDPYWEELAHSQAELDAEETKLSEFIEELTSLGVELKGPDGLCDFPSLRDGREIYLCWRLGEPEVLHWHELNAGFSGRQPLSTQSGARGGPHSN
jgi:hypothetical protein